MDSLKQYDPLLIAWAAGVFEGEGTIGFGVYGHAMARLESTDEDVVRRFAQVVGLGKVYGPYPSRDGYRKPKAVWTASGRATIDRLAHLFGPYLCERRRARFREVIENAVHSQPRSARTRAADCGIYPELLPCLRGRHEHLRKQERPCRRCLDCYNLYRHEARVNR